MRNVCEEEKQQTWIHCRDTVSHLFIALVLFRFVSPYTHLSVCLRCSGWAGGYVSPVSVAATWAHHHVLVFFQNDIGVVVIVEYGDRLQFGRSTTWLWNVLWIHQMDLKRGARFFYIYKLTAVKWILVLLGLVFILWRRTHQCLYYSMISSIHMGVQGKRAFSITVVCCVALRCNNPVLTKDIFKIKIAAYTNLNLNTFIIIGYFICKYMSFIFTCQPSSLKLTYSSCFLQAVFWSLLL